VSTRLANRPPVGGPTGQPRGHRRVRRGAHRRAAGHRPRDDGRLGRPPGCRRRRRRLGSAGARGPGRGRHRRRRCAALAAGGDQPDHAVDGPPPSCAGFLDAVHPKYRTPHRAELTAAANVCAVVLVADLREAIGFSSFAVLTHYALANASAWKLTAQERRWPRWLAGLGVALCVLLAFTLPIIAVAGGNILLATGSHGWLATRHTATTPPTPGRGPNRRSPRASPLSTTSLREPLPNVAVTAGMTTCTEVAEGAEPGFRPRRRACSASTRLNSPMRPRTTTCCRRHRERRSTVHRLRGGGCVPCG
jgi:hypothetical protein